jgi:hypothetical protein
LQHLEVRHRAPARVEDRIRCGKTTGFGRFPSRHSTSTKRGWSCPRPPSTCSPGLASCCWRANSRPPSRKSSATGCCTRLPASLAADAACTCGSPRPGPGETS